MSEAFNLIDNLKGVIEKRVLPRFPLNYLTFRVSDKMNQHHKTYSIRDISTTGMQITKTEGQISFQVGDTFSGDVSWKGEKCEIQAEVKWIEGRRMGVKFISDLKVVDEFLSMDRIVKNTKALHTENLGLNTPKGLKYWFQADGPVEFFLWTFPSGEISKFELIMHKKLFEWDFYKGPRTGEIISMRGKETPLSSEDEFQFHFHERNDEIFMQRCHRFISSLKSNEIAAEDHEFVLNKIRS